MKVKLLSHVRLVATLWTAAYQATPSVGFSRQEYWSRVPLPSPKGKATTLVFWPGEFHGHCIVHGVTESDTTERLALELVSFFLYFFKYYYKPINFLKSFGEFLSITVIIIITCYTHIVPSANGSPFKLAPLSFRNTRLFLTASFLSGTIMCPKHIFYIFSPRLSISYLSKEP